MITAVVTPVATVPVGNKLPRSAGRSLDAALIGMVSSGELDVGKLKPPVPVLVIPGNENGVVASMASEQTQATVHTRGNRRTVLHAVGLDVSLSVDGRTHESSSCTTVITCLE